MRKCFFALIGLVAMIVTVSPSLVAFPASCTRYFLERVWYFLYLGCFTYRSTRTTAVYFPAVFTTTPVNDWGRDVGSIGLGDTKGTGVPFSQGTGDYLAELSCGIRVFGPGASGRETL